MTKAVNGTGETRTPVTAIKSRVPYHLGHSPKSRCVKINQIKLSDIIYNICCPHLRRTTLIVREKSSSNILFSSYIYIISYFFKKIKKKFFNAA